MGYAGLAYSIRNVCGPIGFTKKIEDRTIVAGIRNHLWKLEELVKFERVPEVVTK